MNDMKNYFFAAVIAICAITGCGGQKEKKVMGPEEVVETFCKAVLCREYDKASALCDSTIVESYIESYAASIEKAARQDSSAVAIAARMLETAEITIEDVNKIQDKRQISYTIVITDDLKKEKTATLRKEEGEWKIEAITDRI